jgi:(p)ppGpp synthase/HD superfamily hydrolase
VPTLEDAIALAERAHRGQVDKAGKPYIGHLKRVMNTLDSEEEKTIGVLHDLVEDTDYTADDLKEMGYSDEIVEALVCLTKREGEHYEQFIDRVKTNPIARKVKIVDLKDNMNLERIPSPSAKDLERLEKYRAAFVKHNSM